MGKCISKQATSSATASASTSLLAIEHSVKDLPTGKQHFCTKYAAASADYYVAIPADDDDDDDDGEDSNNDDQANQLCEHQSNNKHANINNIADSRQKYAGRHHGHTTEDADKRHNARQQQQQQQHKRQQAKNNINNKHWQKKHKQQQQQQQQQQKQAKAELQPEHPHDGLNVYRNDNDAMVAPLLLSKNQLEIYKLTTNIVVTATTTNELEESTVMADSNQRGIDEEATSDNTPAASKVMPTTQSASTNGIVDGSKDTTAAGLAMGNADVMDKNAVVGSVCMHAAAAHSMAKNLGNISNNDTNDERHCLAHLSNLFAKQQHQQQQQQAKQCQIQENLSEAAAALASDAPHNNENQSENGHETICATIAAANSNIVASVGNDKDEIFTTKTTANLDIHKVAATATAKDKLTNKLIPNKVTAKYRQNSSSTSTSTTNSSSSNWNERARLDECDAAIAIELICPNSIHSEQIAGNLLCQHSDDIIFLHILTDAMGQAESKKGGKKYCGNSAMDSKETKGTAMSFGFRKKLNSTPKKFKKLLEGNHDFLKHKNKQDKCNNPTDTSAQGHDDDCEIIRTVICNDMLRDDNGNAAETLSTIHFEKMGAAAIAAAAATASAIATGNTQTTNAKSTTTMATTKSALKTTTTAAAAAAATATNGNQGAVTGSDYLPGANNRFGYRGHSIPRPASTGVIARQQQQQQQQKQQNDARDNIDNNNCNGTNTTTTTTTKDGQQPKGSLVSNLKRRSKSANTGRTLTANAEDETMPAKPTQPKTLTFNLNQNTTIEYQRRQFFEQPITTTATDAAYGRFMHPANTINTGMHTNVIVRPTARTAQTAYSKFTLQTVSLPKPEFPVAISLSATTPTTPSSTFSPTKTPHLGNSNGGARAKELTTATHSRQHGHPLTFCATQAPHFDQKSVKQMTNNSTRRGFSGSREISADSGIASMDMPLDSNSSTSSGGMSKRQHASPKRSRSRPRHLQMVMNGRHKFEVRELDDPLSSESSSFVEPLSLPKLPAENQTMPLPLCGLVRSNTVLSRESYERKHHEAGNATVDLPNSKRNNALERNASEESESIDEEKLYLDNSTSEKSAKQRQFRDINTCSSKTSSPGSSIMSSWCNAGESLAVKDCSSLSITSSEDSNKQAAQQHDENAPEHAQQTGEVAITCMDLLDDDNSLINTDMQISTISSITETQNAPQPLNDNVTFADNKLQEQHAAVLHISEDDVDNVQNNDRPKSFVNALNEAKFAEIALAASKYLLDDETSPTDSLVSSTESDDAGGGCDKLKKHKFNEELQEKDIDEISPELEMGSPISPGTPTHASRSLSFSECGNLIDDEIADQPALLFNNDSNQDGADGGRASGSTESRKEKTDTPTLMETTSLRSLKSQSKARTALQQAIELSLRTPISIRKAVMERAESLDTLSPCESICSDDLMMDFDTNSSMDSIDRSASIKSRSGSDLNNLDETTLFSEMERRGSDVMKELNSLLKVRLDRKSEKESVIAHLPARATRLLNRSRLQQQCPLNNADSDSSKSAHSVRLRSVTGSRTSIRSASANAAGGTTAAQQFHSQHHNYHTHKQQQQTQQYQRSHHYQQQQQHHHHHHHHHHQQRLQKRDTHSSSDDLMLYDKSFRNAMIQDVLQFKKQLLRLRRILQETETLNPFENDNGQLFASCGLDSKQLDDLDLASLTSSTTDDPMQELADLRRQVVYLQGQVDDRDRTIRLQRNLIEKLEAEKSLAPHHNHEAPKECITIATQTERSRPPTIGAEGLSRSKPEFTSYTTYFPALCCNDATTIIRHQQQYSGNAMRAMNQTRRHTVISATLTNYNHNALNHHTHNPHNPHHHNHHLQQQQPQHHHSTNTLNKQLTSAAMAATISAAHTNGHLARRASIAWETQSPANYPQAATTIVQQQQQYKPVRITLIGEPMQSNNGITTATTTGNSIATTSNAITTNTTTTTLNNNNNANVNVNDNAINKAKTISLSNLNIKNINNNNNENLHSNSNGNSNSNHNVYSKQNGNDNGYIINNNARQFICKSNTLHTSSDDDLLLANHNFNNNNHNNNVNSNSNNNSNNNINGNANNNNNNNDIHYKAQNGYTKLQLHTDSLHKNYHSHEHIQQQQQQQHSTQQQQQQYHHHINLNNKNSNNFPADKLNPTVTIV